MEKDNIIYLDVIIDSQLNWKKHGFVQKHLSKNVFFFSFRNVPKITIFFNF